MEIIAGSSTHGEVSASELVCRTHILYSTVWVALRRTLLCYPYKIQHYHELLPGDFVKSTTFAVGHFKKRQNMTIDCLTSCVPTKQISRFEDLSFPITSEYWLLKSQNCRANSIARQERHGVV